VVEPNRCSTGLFFQPSDFILDVAVGRLLAEFFQVRVSGKPRKIAVAKAQGFFQRERGAVELAGERVAAREVVKHERAFGFEPCEAFVHVQTLAEAPALRVVVAKQLQRVHIIWVAADDSLDELNLRVEVALDGAARFFSGIAF
jgi:hypothetical protein